VIPAGHEISSVNAVDSSSSFFTRQRIMSEVKLDAKAFHRRAKALLSFWKVIPLHPKVKDRDEEAPARLKRC
jgi:hypothetical protein